MKTGSTNSTKLFPVSHNDNILKSKILENDVSKYIIQLSRITVPPDEAVCEHFHLDMYECFICEKGEGELCVDGISCNLEPGRWVLVEPMEKHSLRAYKSCELVMTLLGFVK